MSATTYTRHAATRTRQRAIRKGDVRLFTKGWRTIPYSNKGRGRFLRSSTTAVNARFDVEAAL